VPLASISKSKDVTVTEYTIYFNAPTKAKQGEKVRLGALVYEVDRPVKGVTVNFYFDWVKIGYGVTDEEGHCELMWTIPYKFNDKVTGCKKHIFNANIPGTEVWSRNVYCYVAHPTRIINFKCPSTAIKDQLFTVSGTLQYAYSSEADWRPLAGKTVKIYVDNELKKTVTTDSDGDFIAQLKIGVAGRHTVKAVYEGEGFALSPASALLEALAGFPWEVWGYPVATLIGAATPLLASAGVIAASELLKVRRI